jgi:predicted RNA binding protein with dsRBD fold (UPF0201 family)
MPRIRVEAEIRPTEDPEKVKRAVLNVFEPDRMWIEKYGDYQLLVAESGSYQSLRKLYELLRRERILDAARSYMLKGVQGGMVVFRVNKQAAYVGRLSFAESETEVPLGPITFVIETRRPIDVVNWLAPETRMGRPIREYEMPED